MKVYFLYITLFLTSCVSNRHSEDLVARKNPNSLKIKLINGNWFNGTTFERRDVWIDEGLLNFSPIDKTLDTIINLDNKFVIPPFAEAHNHNLESEYELDQRIHNYLDNGVFYVKQLSAIKMQLAPLMHLYNKPEGIDISTTYGPLTGTGGHPIALREKFFGWGYFDVFASKQDIESHGYFIIDTEKDLNTKWSHILSFEPEFIKFMLLYSEEYEKRKNDTTYFGNKGMNPKLVKKLVQKAHLAGLRVSVHVETAHDFHVAVIAGVDEIAHLPEIDNGELVAIEDIKMAKEKNITTVTTVTLVKKKSKRANYDELVKNIKANLKLFKHVGAILAIGSDNFNGNSSGEFQFLNELNIFTNLELLNMWTVNATKTIFPNRKVGHLKDGYEANFLVLDKNPLEDISDITKHIQLKVKQGILVY
ncbi:amidohydrolase family protein [uncultured Croceitalea sp.]|uniref:amidohydrolase family protein n=1 Tax=uncultured Croceitalea sp. TaxID=1798908 RepID=UPI0033064109